jgi:hypothetical protein
MFPYVATIKAATEAYPAAVNNKFISGLPSGVLASSSSFNQFVRYNRCAS